MVLPHSAQPTRGTLASMKDLSRPHSPAQSMEAEFWMNLQAHYDMEVVQEALGDRLEREVHPLTKAA